MYLRTNVLNAIVLVLLEMCRIMYVSVVRSKIVKPVLKMMFVLIVMITTMLMMGLVFLAVILARAAILMVVV